MIILIEKKLYLLYPDGAVTVVGRFEVLHKHGGGVLAKEIKVQLQEVPATSMDLTVHLQKGGKGVSTGSERKK